MATRNPERLLAYEAIAEEIKSRIITDSLGPGDRLPTIAEWAQDLGVSQNTVREAYRVLESRGHLQVVQGSGTFVAANVMSVEDLLKPSGLRAVPTRRHLLEARRLLEPPLAAMAAERATAAERAAILKASEGVDLEPGDSAEWARRNLIFHTLVCYASHNPVISEMVVTLYKFFAETEPHPAENPVVREKGIHFHRLIGYAIFDGDREGAHDLMLRHISSVEKILGAPAISRSEPDPGGS